MTNLTLPFINFLLLSNNGTVFHLTNIINSVTRNEVTILKIVNDSYKVNDVLDDTLKRIRNDVAVTVLYSMNSHQKFMMKRSSNILLFEHFYKVKCGLRITKRFKSL